MNYVLTTVVLLFACGLSHAVEADAPTFTPQQLEFFETKVRPVLADNCYKCHSHAAKEKKKLKGGFYLDSRAGILDGYLAEPGKPDESMLIEAVRYDDPTMAMPPSGKLADDVIKDLEKWVEMGMPWPEEAGPGDGEGFDLAARQASHWAWEKPERSERVPERGILDTNAFAIDWLIEDRLSKEGIKPAPAADRATLIRRVTLDLTGLPPTPDEVDAFVNDKSPDAYERLVDRLLASPRYGEKWARHWLDLVRYAESYGHEFDYNIPHAWKYRDYVIRALNDDVPYDRFVHEHIAGDLIAPRIHPETKVNEAVKATGWWYLHEQTHAPTDVRLHEADRIDNQLDALSKTFMGMTVACARCHDHKFDAISEDDYYSLAGYLQSSRQQEAYLDPGGKIDKAVATAKKVLADWEAFYDKIGVVKAQPTKIEHADSHLFEDFNRGSFDGWRATGWAWGERPTRPGTPDPHGEAYATVLPGVAHSGLAGDQAVGTLRSPEFDYTHRHVWLRVKGKGHIRLILDSYTMSRHNGLLFEGLHTNVDTKGKWQWVRLSAKRDFYHDTGHHRGHLEIIDDHADAHLQVDEVRLGDKGAPPNPEPHALTPPREVAEGHPDTLRAFAERFAEANKAIPMPERALAITDGSAENSYVHIRGAWRGKGETQPRRTLTALGGEQMPTPDTGSGRALLAQNLTDPSNPLTARVQVNRLWHHLFGVGIVPTVDNLGYLGLPPSHRELLDHLAVVFVEDDNWSTKAMVKRIVMSRAYQRASDKTDAQAEEKDPTNTLLHRQRIRRMPAETLRDSILFVAGSLNEKRFGPPVDVHLTAFMQGRGKPKQGPLDGNGRRSIYTSVRRNFLPPMMLTFDMPIPFSTVGRRNQSNVPAQALTLMNDPFVHDQADKWARRLVEAGGDNATVATRIDDVFRSAIGRAPTPAERDTAAAFIADQARQHGLSADDNAKLLADHRPWSALCHAILNIKGFSYIR